MIVLIGGKPRNGKSFDLCEWVVGQLLRGRTVFCDIPIFVVHKGYVYRTAELTRDMIRNFAFREKDRIAINEGGSWFDSRNFSRNVQQDVNAFTTQDLELFTQHAQSDIQIKIVAQDIAMLDANIRRCTEYFWHIRKFPPSGWEWYYGEDGKRFRPWFFFKTCYFSESDYLSPNPKEKPDIRIKRYHKKIEKCYDTKYHRFLMQQRPVKEFKYWDYKFYEARKSITGDMIVPDNNGKLYHEKPFWKKRRYVKYVRVARRIKKWFGLK